MDDMDDGDDGEDTERPLGALRQSVARLRREVRDLDDGALNGPSYCSEWSVADVLSHLGSGAVIMRRNLDDTLGGGKTPEDFSQAVWDEWNAKTPRAQADDALETDAALLGAFEAVRDSDRERCAFPLGPFTLGFDQAVGLRLNEHVLHTWDVEVMRDAGAVLPKGAAAQVVDNVALIARFVAKPKGEQGAVRLQTTEPARAFTIALSDDAVHLEPGAEGEPDVVLPAEAFCRLVYGRLDPHHTPPVRGDATLLDMLRRVFPGF